jgi:hypothetical protein
VHGKQHQSQPARLTSRDPRNMRNYPSMSVDDVRPVSDCRISERSPSDWQAALFTSPQASFTATQQARWLLKRPTVTRFIATRFTAARFAQPKTLSMLRLNTSPTERMVCVGSRHKVGSKASSRMIPAAAYRGKAVGIAGRVAV